MLRVRKRKRRVNKCTIKYKEQIYTLRGREKRKLTQGTNYNTLTAATERKVIAYFI